MGLNSVDGPFHSTHQIVAHQMSGPEMQKKRNDAETCEPEHRQFIYSIFICTLNMLNSSFVETETSK